MVSLADYNIIEKDELPNIRGIEGIFVNSAINVIGVMSQHSGILV